MISDTNGTDDRQQDAEWAWVASVYREVPAPAPTAVGQAAERAIQASPSLGRRVWWPAAAAASVAAVGAGMFWLGRDRGPSSLPPVTSPTAHVATPLPPSPDSFPAADTVPVIARRQAPGPVVAGVPQAAVPPQAVPSADTMPAVRDSLPVVSGPPVLASLGPAEPRLRAALGERGVQELAGILDRAAAAGVSREPLIDRALAGVAREVPVSGILAAVERRAVASEHARDALGRSASAAEITAGADAIEAGATMADVALVRRRFPASRATAGLLALAGLAADGVPAAAAAEALAQRVGASDASLLALQRGVAADVARGVSPLAALRARIQHLEGAAADDARVPSAGQKPRPSPIDPPRAP